MGNCVSDNDQISRYYDEEGNGNYAAKFNKRRTRVSRFGVSRAKTYRVKEDQSDVVFKMKKPNRPSRLDKIGDLALEKATDSDSLSDLAEPLGLDCENLGSCEVFTHGKNTLLLDAMSFYMIE